MNRNCINTSGPELVRHICIQRSPQKWMFCTKGRPNSISWACMYMLLDARDKTPRRDCCNGRFDTVSSVFPSIIMDREDYVIETSSSGKRSHATSRDSSNGREIFIASAGCYTRVSLGIISSPSNASRQELSSRRDVQWRSRMPARNRTPMA